MSTWALDGGASNEGGITLDVHHCFRIVRSRESSTADGIVAVLRQAEGVEAADVKLHVTVARHRAVLEGIVLVEVSESIDSSIARTRPRGPVVHDDATIEGVVGRVVIKGDAVIVCGAVLGRERVEGVITRSVNFDRASVGPTCINGDIGESTVRCAGNLKSEGDGARSRIQVWNGSAIDG